MLVRFLKLERYGIIMEQRTRVEEVKLILAKEEDAEKIHNMKYQAFMPLYEKYQDYDTNPAMEPIEKTIMIINQDNTDYYLIKLEDVFIGAVRVGLTKSGVRKIAPIFILPEYQNRGIGTIIFRLLFEKYKDTELWVLDTIEEEKGNCHFYEKLGFIKATEQTVINDKMTIIGYEMKRSKR